MLWYLHWIVVKLAHLKAEKVSPFSNKVIASDAIRRAFVTWYLCDYLLKSWSMSWVVLSYHWRWVSYSFHHSTLLDSYPEHMCFLISRKGCLQFNMLNHKKKWSQLTILRMPLVECQTSGIHAKRASADNKKWQSRGLLVFSELPGFFQPTADRSYNWQPEKGLINNREHEQPYRKKGTRDLRFLPIIYNFSNSKKEINFESAAFNPYSLSFSIVSVVLIAQFKIYYWWLVPWLY
jgi:hypothetical protein